MKNFIILGTQRTGSSAIAKLINLHPFVLCGLEWTQHTPSIRKIKTAKELLSCNFNSLKGFHKEYLKEKDFKYIRWVGFKILFSSSDKWFLHPKYSPALWNDQLKRHITWLINCPSIHIVHIVRNDHMDWLKSVFMAKTTGIFSGKIYPEGLKLDIKIRKAIARIKSKIWVDSQISLLKLTNPYFRVDYESFKNNNRKTAYDIMNFLNCDPSLINPARYTAVRQSRGHAKKYIRNYSHLYQVLKRNDLL